VLGRDTGFGVPILWPITHMVHQAQRLIRRFQSAYSEADDEAILGAEERTLWNTQAIPSTE
jgi:hypothetical protein